MNFQHFGGYHESDLAIRAFSHLHLVGAGVIDMGVIGILPIIPRNHTLPPKINENRVTTMIKEN
jgi:hypothetical protein